VPSRVDVIAITCLSVEQMSLITHVTDWCTACASVTKQYNLLPANGRWCFAAGKVTVGLASHWPRVTDITGSPPTGSRPRRGTWAPACVHLVEYGRLCLTLCSGYNYDLVVILLQLDNCGLLQSLLVQQHLMTVIIRPLFLCQKFNNIIAKSEDNVISQRHAFALAKNRV